MASRRQSDVTRDQRLSIYISFRLVFPPVPWNKQWLQTNRSTFTLCYYQNFRRDSETLKIKDMFVLLKLQRCLLVNKCSMVMVFLPRDWCWPRTARERLLAWWLGSCLRTPPNEEWLLDDIAALYSQRTDSLLPCAQTVFLYIILWFGNIEQIRRKPGYNSGTSGWLCYSFYSLVHCRPYLPSLLFLAI